MLLNNKPIEINFPTPTSLRVGPSQPMYEHVLEARFTKFYSLHNSLVVLYMNLVMWPLNPQCLVHHTYNSLNITSCSLQCEISAPF